MAKNNPSNRGGNRGGNRSGSRGSRSSNNNPEGRNQYTSGLMGMARERPAAAAAAAAGAVAAGVFLWSKRAQISDQLNQLSEQIGEWKDNMNSDREFETVGAEADFSGASSGGTSGEFAGSGDTGGKSGGTPRSSRKTSGTRTASPRRNASRSSLNAGNSETPTA
jgi:hypothetical protein